MTERKLMVVWLWGKAPMQTLLFLEVTTPAVTTATSVGPAGTWAPTAAQTAPSRLLCVCHSHRPACMLRLLLHHYWTPLLKLRVSLLFPRMLHGPFRLRLESTSSKTKSLRTLRWWYESIKAGMQTFSTAEVAQPWNHPASCDMEQIDPCTLV